MDEFLKELSEKSNVSISVIDYIGKMENGVGILLSLVIGETSYQIAYWFNRDGYVRVVPESEFLERIGVDDIYKYENIDEFIYFIHNSLQDPDAILNEFLKEE